MCTALHSKDQRLGAMMAALRCDHPDVEAFIDAKRRPDVLTNFNLSVQITDDFMRAVTQDKDFSLVFPPLASPNQTPGSISGGNNASKMACRVYRVLRARALWNRLLRAAYNNGEPGVLFIDRINQLNNLHYTEHITTTNPCGEAPLPAVAACDLGSINLVRFVSSPFRPTANIDLDRIAETVKIAVRLLDNIIDISGFPLAEQKHQVLNTRRIGLGITGLADALVLLGITYGERRSFDLAAKIASVICHTAYRTSAAIAEEKGAFPLFEREQYLRGGFIQSLPADVRALIRQHGIRNSHLLAVAPTGTISLLADNVSSGVEPIFGLRYQRDVINPERETVTYMLENHAYHCWRAMYQTAPLPEQFITADCITPAEQVTMLAAIQPYVDNAISKTIHIPTNYEFNDFRVIFDSAYDLGLKGCTVFRSNSARRGIIQHCNDAER